MYQALSYKRPAGWTHLQRGLGVLLLGPECHAVERVRDLRDAALDECAVLAAYSSAARMDISAELARARACARTHTYYTCTHADRDRHTDAHTHTCKHTHAQVLRDRSLTRLATNLAKKIPTNACKETFVSVHRGLQHLWRARHLKNLRNLSPKRARSRGVAHLVAWPHTLVAEGLIH